MFVAASAGFCPICPSGRPPTVSYAWDPSPTFPLSHYNFKVGKRSGSYFGFFEVRGPPNTAPPTTYTYTIYPDFAPGETIYTIVTAVNTIGLESDPSNEISYAVPDYTRPNGELNQGPYMEYSCREESDGRGGTVRMLRLKFRLQPDSPTNWYLMAADNVTGPYYVVTETATFIETDNWNNNVYEFAVPAIEAKKFFKLQFSASGMQALPVRPR